MKEYKPNVSGVAICKECGLRSRICKNDHTGGWKPKAVEAWNTRTSDQAIAATLGKQKAKAHPYGYEPDTGAFDTTRCECGCLNDISARFCNDCGGEIEIDEDGDKEIYKGRRSVFATKHDDGSLEFGGKRYVVATIGDNSDAVAFCKRIEGAVANREPLTLFGVDYSATLAAVK